MLSLASGEFSFTLFVRSLSSYFLASFTLQYHTPPALLPTFIVTACRHWPTHVFESSHSFSIHTRLSPQKPVRCDLVVQGLGLISRMYISSPIGLVALVLNSVLQYHFPPLHSLCDLSGFSLSLLTHSTVLRSQSVSPCHRADSCSLSPLPLL